jgi:5-methylcytosine-specific restriction endonuclease McrA
VYGDHIIELQDGGERLDPRNIQLSCAKCHGIKTYRERQRRNANRNDKPDHARLRHEQGADDEDRKRE